MYNYGPPNVFFDGPDISGVGRMALAPRRKASSLLPVRIEKNITGSARNQNIHLGDDGSLSLLSNRDFTGRWGSLRFLSDLLALRIPGHSKIWAAQRRGSGGREAHEGPRRGSGLFDLFRCGPSEAFRSRGGQRFLAGALLAMVFLMASKAAGQTQDGQKTSQAASSFKFALSLFDQGDYYRSISEWKRSLFLAPKGPLAAQSGLWIGIAYTQGEKYSAALAAFASVGKSHDTVIGRASLFSAEILLADGRLEEAENVLGLLLEAPPGDDFPLKRARYALAWVYLGQGKSEQVQGTLKNLLTDPHWGTRAQTLSKAAGQAQNIPKRDPALGGILSAIIPGLGQAVSGRWTDGLSALLVNGLFAGAAVESFRTDRNTLGILLTTLGVAWYTGNIFAGANAASRLTKLNRAQYMEDTWQSSRLPPMADVVEGVPKERGHKP